MPSESPRRPASPAEWIILDLLLEAAERTLSIAELVEAVGSPIAVADALDTLHVAGLIGRRADLAILTSPPL